VEPAASESLLMSYPLLHPLEKGKGANVLLATAFNLVPAVQKELGDKVKFAKTGYQMQWLVSEKGFRFVPVNIDPGVVDYGPAVPVNGDELSGSKAPSIALQDATLAAIEKAWRIEALVFSVNVSLDAQNDRTDDVFLKTRLLRYGGTENCDFATTPAVLPDDSRIRACDGVAVEVHNKRSAKVYPFLFVLSDTWDVLPITPDCKKSDVPQSVYKHSVMGEDPLKYPNDAIQPGIARYGRNALIMIAVPPINDADPITRICELASSERTRGLDDEIASFRQLLDGGATRGLSESIQRKVVMNIVTWDVDQEPNQ
jgi:hypothetical protein